MIGQLNHRILLVEDNLPVQKLIARHLLAAGYVVRTAGDGLDGIAKLRAGLPDLIISDLAMPGMSGVEFLSVVRKRFPQTPVIAISSATQDEIPEGLAADAYCTKSGHDGFQELLAAVSALAGGPSPRTDLPASGCEPAEARWDGASLYFVRCGDCLREFPVGRIFGSGDKKQTTCVHCGKVLEILLAPSGAPV